MGNFKTKARAIELLGRKQIRDSVTALAELMKNSYDADASWLRVEFDTKKEHIIIADGGSGMTKSDIEDKWLVLGTNSKTNNRNKKSPGGRTLMGAKGIGRLASARLGKELWMFTKNALGAWNIVYINWNLFENPYLSLDNIQVPALYEISAVELKEKFHVIKEDLIKQQKENLNLDGWFELNGNEEKQIKEDIFTLYNETEECINQCSISINDIKKFLSSSQGTILYINELNDDNWASCFAPTSGDKKDEDLITAKYFNRLASFVSAFRHAGSEDDPFDVKIYVNNEPWEEDYSYIEEDYEIYDIKIQGTIKSGKFYGMIDARNGDVKLLQQANAILTTGRDVTQGIANWKEVDCGDYRIKLCHIEGERKNSGLSDDDYNRLRRKLDVTGGVCIYRDGVRVLPYGEPENDFLNMEERRSYNAGNYIFSHRNIFGRIDINSQDNPKLEDKSSREGLIENAQYFYFIKTMENLLKDLAFNFFSSARKESLAIRNGFVEKNTKALEEKKQRQKIEREEKRKAVKYIKELKELLQDGYRNIEEYKKKGNRLISQWTSRSEKISIDSGYNRISSELDQLTSEYDQIYFTLEKMQTELTINIEKRFLSYCSESLCREVETFNSCKEKELNTLEADLRSTYLQSRKILQKNMEEWIGVAGRVLKTDPDSYKLLLKERLNTILDNSRQLFDNLDDEIYKNQNILKQKTEVARKLLEKIDSYYLCIENKENYRKLSNAIKEVPQFSNRIDEVFNGKPEKMGERGDELLNNLEDSYQNIYKLIQVLKLDIKNNFEENLSGAQKLEISIDSEYTNEYLIGELRTQNINLQSENEIYSDLANLGLASEIVSHEFNQLYTNVRNAIRNLAPYVRDSNAKYWLRQIEVGFRAVSDRQNQLSPMYRSYSLRRRNVKLREFIEEVCSFMSNMLEKIHIDNQIAEDVELNISPSKMFPAISNIVNNASYWVLNQDEKIIRFRFDELNSVLYIEDSGAGITALDQNSIFQPFVSYKPNGRGLGLAIVRKVLESQGYKIEIAKEEEKTLLGACFKITFK